MKSLNRRRRAKKGTRAQPISHEKNRPQGAGEQSEARPHAASPAARHIPQPLADTGHAAARRDYRFRAGVALPPFRGQGAFVRRDRAARRCDLRLLPIQIIAARRHVRKRVCNRGDKAVLIIGICCGMLIRVCF